MIRKLHHSAYRCRDSEETRRFYEDFLGLPLAGHARDRGDQERAQTRALHTFYRLDDGSFIAFFEAPDMPFDFKAQHDYDLHIALEVDGARARGDAAPRAAAQGIETRGIADHGFIESIYFRDPNGYVIELARRNRAPRRRMDPATNGARAKLRRWTTAARVATTL